jgi:LemA protein
MRKVTLFSIFLLLIAAITAVGVVYYNIFIGRSEKVDQRWAQVETVMQRRLDLIPNLVEIVKGYAAHERETLAMVIEARSRLLDSLSASGRQAPESDAELNEIRGALSGMGTSLGRLLAIVENYPDLKASQNFRTLQDQLEGTENRIAIERNRYNQAVLLYNRGIKMFPGNLVAGLAGFEPRIYFEALPEAGQEVKAGF